MASTTRNCTPADVESFLLKNVYKIIFAGYDSLVGGYRVRRGPMVCGIVCGVLALVSAREQVQ